MKTRTCWALVSLTALFFSTPVVSKAAVSFSAGIEIRAASDFYDPLQAYGQWVNVGSYGRCWHPTVTLEAGWRPYSVGEWEWTDCGWYWSSDEPWAWACYHYGYWAFDPQFGWVWVPGTEWAPAWVVWRESPDYDYIGWAPCGPGGVVVSPSLFCFIDAHRFHDRIRPGELIINDTRLIQRTRVIRGIDRETRNFDGRRERVVVNRGPEISGIQRVTGQRFTARPIRDVVRSTPLPQPVLQRAEPWRRENARTIQGQSQNQRNRETQPGRTGREQQRSYQQPSGNSQTAPQNRTYEQRRSQPGATTPTPSTREQQQRNNLSPSGREQPRTYERPSQQPSSTLTPQPKTPAHTYTPPASTTPSTAPSTSREQRNQTRTVTPSGRESQRTYEQPSSVPERSAQPRTYTPSSSAPSTAPAPAPSQRERRERPTVTPSGRDESKVYQAPPRSQAAPSAPREAPAQTHAAPVVRETPAATHVPEHAAPAPRIESAPPAPQQERGRDKDRDR